MAYLLTCGLFLFHAETQRRRENFILIMQLWKVIINGKEYAIENDNGKFTLNGKAVELDIARIRANEFHVLHENKSFNVEVVDQSPAEKKLTIKVNGNEYAVTVKDKLDLLLQQMGMTKQAALTVGNIKAPMPGKVLRVDVQEGQQLKKGDAVLILEAMKMENTIKSPCDGTVKKILVKQGDAVEKGTVLVEME